MAYRTRMIMVTLFVAWVSWLIGINANGALISGTWRQMQTGSWPTVEGVVAQSEVVKRHSYFVPEIRYVYEVDGQRFTAERVSYRVVGRTSHAQATTVAQRFATGRTITVHYDPQEPRAAVLVTGTLGRDWIGTAILLPMNLAILIAWYWLGGYWRRRLSGKPAGGLPLRRHGDRIIVRMPRGPGLIKAATAAFVVSGICIIVILVFFGANTPAAAVVVAGIAVIAAPIITIRRGTRGADGRDGDGSSADLVIDAGARTVRLPMTFGRSGPVTVPFDAVASIDVKRSHVLIRFRRGSPRKVDVYKPTLEWRRDDGHTAEETLEQWYDPERADDFASWLSTKVLLNLAA